MIGRIYKIIHRQSDICYIGSTINMLKHRWYQHTGHFTLWEKGDSNKGCSIYPHFKKHGIEQFKIILIKEYDVCDKKQLLAYETLWINKFRRTCVNQVHAFAILRQEKRKQYRENNQEAIREQLMEYRNTNAEAIREQNKKYRAANADVIRERKKKYRTTHAAAIRESQNKKYDCECGGRFSTTSRYTHIKTMKHANWVAAQ